MIIEHSRISHLVIWDRTGGSEVNIENGSELNNIYISLGKPHIRLISSSICATESYENGITGLDGGFELYMQSSTICSTNGYSVDAVCDNGCQINVDVTEANSYIYSKAGWNIISGTAYVMCNGCGNGYYLVSDLNNVSGGGTLDKNNCACWVPP